jgi:cysteine-rich repeat protein
VVFDPSKLHEVALTVDPAYLDALEHDLDNRVPCTLSYDGVVLAGVGVKKRAEGGAVATLAGKPALSLKIDELDKGKDLYTLTRVELESSVKDPSLLHQHVGYELYRRAGILAPRTAHAVVTLNGAALGVYVVADAMDKKAMARAFGAQSFDGNLYEGVCCGDFVTDVAHMDLQNEQSEGRSRVDLLALAKTVATASDADFATKVDARMDLGRFVLGYALDALLVHRGYSFLPIADHWLYDNPTDGRFVFLPSGMDDALGDLNASPFRRPDARVSRRVRAIPELDAAYRDAVMHVLYDLWDPAALHARVDAVTKAIASAPANEPKVKADVDAYAARVADVHVAIDLRRSKVLAAAAAVCGDGLVEGFEECDDHGAASGDGCSAVCMKELCGDGIVQAGLGEQCDGPGCKPDCSGASSCGDGKLDPGEACDDGNLAPNDGCGSSCELEGCTTVAHAGATYAFCKAKRTAFDARAICGATGGALAVPGDAPTSAWLATTAFGVFGQSYWIGPTDEAKDGAWLGPDGAPVTFFAWAPNEPNGGPLQACVVLSLSAGGAWNDKACSETNGFVCELP